MRSQTKSVLSPTNKFQAFLEQGLNGKIARDKIRVQRNDFKLDRIKQERADKMEENRVQKIELNGTEQSEVEENRMMYIRIEQKKIEQQKIEQNRLTIEKNRVHHSVSYCTRQDERPGYTRIH